MKANRITALLLAGVMSVSLLMGCGSIDQTATIASADGTDVSMGVANFYCRYQQASVEDMYKSYFGDDIWTQDMYGNGTTMQDSLKESVIEELHEMYTLKNHMDDYGISLTDEEKTAITTAAASFMSSNSQEAISEMGATQEIVEEVLTFYTISSKMKDAIEAEADTNVSDEEANMRGYTQIEIKTDSHTDDAGNSVDYTDAEAAELYAEAVAMVSQLAEEGATLESVAKEHGYETAAKTYATYESEDADGEEDPVKTALKSLSVGETSDVIETDNAIYIVRVDSDTDAEATANNRESIIKQRKTDHYNEVLEGWQTDDGWKVNSDLFGQIQFENALTQTDPNAAPGTESAGGTEGAQ